MADTRRDRGNRGLGAALHSTTCRVCDSQAALPVGGDLMGTVAFWCVCGFSPPKIAICRSGRISEVGED